jgi:PAS domain S-box-containing protein
MEPRSGGPPANEALYRGLFENNHAVMLLIDPASGAILDANPAACAYYGWSRAELQSLTIHAINTLSPAEIAGQMALAAAGRRSAFAFRHRRADGSVRDVEVHSGPVELDGRALLFSIVHDVTDRNEIQASLAESERRLSTLMASLPGMAYRCLNDERWTMLFVSDGCHELTGHPAHELLENRRVSYNDLIHPDDRRAVWNQVQASLGRRAPFHLTYRIRTAGGDEKWVMERGQGVFAPGGGLIALEGLISDITRLKRAEEALRESEEKFRLAFQMSPDAVNLNRLADGMYLDINAGFTELTGFTRAEAIGRTSLDISVWSDPGDRERLVAALREKGQVDNFEARFRRKNGEVGIGLMSARVLRIGDEEVILSVTRDITARKRVEERLRESEDRYRRIVEATTAGMLMCAGERVIYANPAALRMLGARRPEDIVGRPYLDLVHPEDRSESAARLEQSSDPAWIAPPREHRLVGPDGRVVHVESTGVPIQLGGKRRHLAIFIDITDRKRAEASLRESEEKYRELAESLPQVIFEIDPQGRLNYFNRTGYRLFGYLPEELPPDFNVLAAIAPEDRERAAADILGSAAGRDSSRDEYTAIKKDGTRFPVGIHATRILRDETVVGIRGMLLDLTPASGAARRRSERLEIQLQQAQKMEAIGARRRDRARLQQHPRGHHRLHRARHAERGRGSHSAELEAGAAGRQAGARPDQADPRLQPPDRRGAHADPGRPRRQGVREVFTGDHPLHDRDPDPDRRKSGHGARQQRRAAPDHHEPLHQRAARDRRAERHARDRRSTRRKSTRTRKQDAVGLDAGATCASSVRDTGGGMEPEIIGQDIRPLLHHQEKGVGTGLGLAVVHGIVRKSRRGHPGSRAPRAGVHLPHPASAGRQPSAAQAEMPIGVPVGGHASGSSSSTTRMMLAASAEQMLKKLGYEVVARTSPVEALELFRAKPGHFDLVVTDQTMPGMTGDALARELMRIRPGLPVIMLCTGYSQSIEREKSRRNAGSGRFVMKPILINELDAAIRKALAD